MTGFRSNGQFYTDPAIAKMDFDIITMLGMNAMWEQNGGQPGALRQMAREHGINRTTVYWRNPEDTPYDETVKGTRADWDALGKWADGAYRANAEAFAKAYPLDPPDKIVDLSDEPAGRTFAGPEYEAEFRAYARAHNLTPEFFGQTNWDAVVPTRLGWGEFFVQRAALDQNDPNARHLFYWSAKFWNECTARNLRPRHARTGTLFAFDGHARQLRPALALRLRHPGARH